VYGDNVGNTTSTTPVTAAQLENWVKEHSPPDYIRAILDPIAATLKAGETAQVCVPVLEGKLQRVEFPTGVRTGASL
jgi:hypothetical protein